MHRGKNQISRLDEGRSDGPTRCPHDRYDETGRASLSCAHPPCRTRPNPCAASGPAADNHQGATDCAHREHGRREGNRYIRSLYTAFLCTQWPRHDCQGVGDGTDRESSCGADQRHDRARRLCRTNSFSRRKSDATRLSHRSNRRINIDRDGPPSLTHHSWSRYSWSRCLETIPLSRISTRLSRLPVARAWRSVAQDWQGLVRQ